MTAGLLQEEEEAEEEKEKEEEEEEEEEAGWVGRRKASATREVVATVVGEEIEIEVDEWVLRRGKRRREGRPSSSADGIDGGRLPFTISPILPSSLPPSLPTPAASHQPA